MYIMKRASDVCVSAISLSESAESSSPPGSYSKLRLSPSYTKQGDFLVFVLRAFFLFSFDLITFCSFNFVWAILGQALASLLGLAFSASPEYIM